MATAVYSGISVEVDFSASFSWTQGAQAALEAIAANLQSQGLMTVEDYTVTVETIPVLPGSFSAIMHVAPYTSTDTDSLIASISQAISQVTGQPPSAIDIPSVGGSATGQPQQPSSDFISQAVSSVSNFFSGITQKITTATSIGLIVIVAVVVLALILIAYSPNVGHIAGALA